MRSTSCRHAPDRRGHVVAVFHLLEYEIDVFGIDVDVKCFLRYQLPCLQGSALSAFCGLHIISLP